MSKEIFQDNTALVPHKYPLPIKLFIGLIIIMTLYSIALSPKYLVAARKIHEGKQAYAMRDYSKAVSLYQSALKIIPSSKEARIGIAEAIFANGDASDDEIGVGLLSGITLNEWQWNRLAEVMPLKYQQFFGHLKQ